MDRCSVCQGRHPEAESCPDPGEEGHISRDELMDAFRCGHGVCLACQLVTMREPGEGNCPCCGEPFERFSDDDLTPGGDDDDGPR